MAKLKKPVSEDKVQVDKVDTDVKASVRNEDLFTTCNGPAILTNHVTALANQAGVRLVFAEVMDESRPPVFRSAVFMDYNNIQELLRLLGQIIAQVQTAKG